MAPVSIKPKGFAFAHEVKCAVLRGGNQVRKSAVPAMSMGNEPDLAPDFAQVQFIELVMDESVLGRLAGRSRKVPFNTRLVTQSDGSVGYWTGEGDAIGVSQMVLSSTSLTPLHVASIMVASDEFLRHSSVEAETTLRRDLSRGLALAIDQTFLDPNNSGTANVKPASITDGVTAVETISDLMESFTGDLTKSVWIGQPQVLMGLRSAANPDVGLHGGELWGAQALASRSAPDSSLILVDPTGLTFASGELEYETSQFSTVQMESAPTQMADGSPASPSDDPVPTTVVSLYQANAVAIKLSMYLNYKVRPGSVGMVTFDESPGGSPL